MNSNPPFFVCVLLGLPPGHHALGPQLVRALVPSTSCMSPGVLTSQEVSQTSHSTVSPHPLPQQVSPQLPPNSSGAAQQQQVRAGPVVKIPVTAPVAQNHSPQSASVLPAQQQQQHSPMVSAGTPVTVFQQVPQGHILTARVQGVCPPIAQNPPLPQTPPLCGPQGGAPQIQSQCVAVPSTPSSSIQGSGQAFSVATVSSSQGSRVAFQNIAPKPAPNPSGVPAATIATSNQQPQQQQQAQSVVLVNPSPQQNPAYTPAIHQIVLANPSAISGAQTIQIAGQPGAASTSCPSHIGNQVQSNQTVSQTLSMKRHQQQQQLPIISQTPPPQPTSTESSLIKQLLLPKRGPSTPGGKLILPAPQMPLPNSTIAPSPQVIYQTSYNTPNPSPQPQQLNVQLVPGQLPAVGAPAVQTVQLLPGQLISTSSAGTTAIIQGPTAAGKVTFAVVPNTGFTTSTAAVAAVSQGTVTQGLPPPYSTGTIPQHTPAAPPPPLPAPLRGDKIICQKEEEAKDATGLHVHERTIEVMENSSLAEGNSSNGKTSNGDVGACAKLLNGQKCMESNLPPYHSGNSQGALNGPTPEIQPANGKQALSSNLNAPPEDNSDPKKSLVNGVCDFDKSDNGGNCNKNIPNHIASKQYLGNGELSSSEKSHGSEPTLPSPPQQDTAKAQQTERLANGPQAAGIRPPSELTNGPLIPAHAAPVLRQQLLPNSTFPPTVPLPSQSTVASPTNGVTPESRGLKRPAESEDRGAAPASSGIPNKVGVRIITISDPNNAGSSATMVAVPAGTDPSTVAKVAIENAAQQRNCSPTQAAGSTVSHSPLCLHNLSFYSLFVSM